MEERGTERTRSAEPRETRNAECGTWNQGRTRNAERGMRNAEREKHSHAKDAKDAKGSNSKTEGGSCPSWVCLSERAGEELISSASPPGLREQHMIG